MSYKKIFLLICFLAFSGCHNLSVSTTVKTASQQRKPCPDVSVISDDMVARSLSMSLVHLEALKSARSLSNKDLCIMPDQGLKRSLARLDKPKPDHPGEWATFRAMQRRSDDGTVKPDGLVKALEHRKNMLKKQDSFISPAADGLTDESAETAVAGTISADLAPAGSGVGIGQWTNLGPGHIGGRIRAILIDSTNTSKIWIGSVSGGIWSSQDSGVSWKPVNDFMGNLSVSSLVMAPDNPAVIYAGTGEGFYNADAVRGAGIFKSTDGGVTWNQLAAASPAANSAWYYVNRLAISPTDSRIILAATNSGIFRSSDGGSSWTRVNTTRMLDIKFDQNNPNKAVGGGSSVAMYSTDGGITWTTVSGMTGRIEVAYARSQPDLVYASVGNSTTGGELWKSMDGGKTWALVSTPKHVGSQGWYDNTIWVDPTDAAHLIVGGLDLWRTTNAGVTWMRISNWVNNMYGGRPNIPHADHHALVADPNYNGTTNRTIYNGNDGGIFRSLDIAVATQSTGWETLNNGLDITQFYSGAGHSSAGGRIFGGAQDNGCLMRSSTDGTWTMTYGGDGGFSAVDSQDDNYLYGEYTYLQLHRSSNGGLSAVDIYSGITDAGASGTANFIAPFILDPNDNNRMLAGGRSLWQSMAAKAPTVSWTEIKTTIGSNISAIAVAEGNSNITWVGHSNGYVYRSSDSLTATPTWDRVGTGRLPARMVNRILIDKDQPDKVYIAFGGYNTGNLMRTTDNGQTWTDISSNLPSVPIFSITRHPANANWLYAGTEVGLFSSTNGGASWSTTNDGPANVEISEMFWLNDTNLVASTHGRGMFKAMVLAVPDVTPPTITSFALPAVWNATGVPVSAFTATDEAGGSGIAGYLITENPSPPLATDSGWSLKPPASYAFNSTGMKSLYAWVKDAVDNVSTPATASVNIVIDAIPPTTTASPDGGTYGLPVAVTLTANEPATIFYTLDGSEPTAASAVYGEPIVISSPASLKFFAKDSAGNDEMVQTRIYSFYPVRVISQNANEPAYFTNIQDAFGKVASGDVIQLRTGDFREDLILGQNAGLTLNGGHDSNWNNRGGEYSHIKGSLTIAGGPITLDTVVLQ